MSEPGRLTVGELFVKTAHREPMHPARELQLSRFSGILGSAMKISHGPRHVCLASTETLAHCGVSAAEARVNMTLRTASPEDLASGNLLVIGEAAVRIAFLCEVCSHGARLAAAPMRRFRKLRRMIGVVVRDGTVRCDTPVQVVRSAFEPVPETFAERCTWSVARIPRGHAVDAGELLVAVGAGPSYHRVLPRWLKSAGAQGAPIHRVLSTALQAPSWAPDALNLLEAEGARSPGGGIQRYPLIDALWFDEQLLWHGEASPALDAVAVRGA